MLEEYEKNLFYKSIHRYNINDYSNYTPFIVWMIFYLNDEMVEEYINYYMNELTEYYYEIFGGNEKEKKV